MIKQNSFFNIKFIISTLKKLCDSY